MNNNDNLEFFEFKLEKLKNELNEKFEAKVKETMVENGKLKEQIDHLNNQLAQQDLKQIDPEDDEDLNYTV